LNAPNGKQFISASVIRTPNFQGNAFICSWAGENLSNTNFGRFRPRITSDNAKYNNTSSVYIAVSTDSLVSAGVYKGWYNYVLCVNPYTVNPVLDYYGRGIVLFSSTLPTDLHSDIAYVYNNGDSIIMVSSNNYKYPEQIGISVVNNHFGGLNGQSYDNGNTFEKGFTRIASSGGTNQLTSMIVYRENYQNSGDWDIKAYKSTSSLYSWQSIDIDVRRDNVLVPNPPDICAVRNKENRYYISYTNSGLSNYDTVKYLFTSQNTSTITYRTVSHLNAFARPKPGFRLVNNDSCLDVWSQKSSGGGDNIWVSEGCSGPFSIGIKTLGSEIPTTYKLEQNYPNPFNPVTNIRFNIPPSKEAGKMTQAVRLVIYDVLGKEVAIVVNENLQPGIYKVDFNASSLPSGAYFYKIVTDVFTDVKKMMLIK
jgi:hypothetical protein